MILVSCSSGRRYTHDAPLLPGMSGQAIQDEPLAPEEEEVPDLDSKPVREEKEDTKEGEEEMDVSLDPDTQNRKKRQIPFEFNQKVASWIEYFSQKDRERFQRFFDRGEPYREVIQNILEENGVPTDLYYLGMIESGFNAHATSSAQAIGVWQFMKATGKSYGLQADRFVDERRDPIRATEAAAKYLRDLHRTLGSWYLAMAAYNAGQGRIGGAIRRAGTNDFWELVDRRKLPKETMEYVPKFLAARYIGENPDLFAFYINEEKKYPDVELVKVPSPVTFASIERTCGIPEGTLQFVNPHFLKGHTHPGLKTDEIWVPLAYTKMVAEKGQALAAQRIRVRVPTDKVRVRQLAGAVPVYRVKKGDTLLTIAKKRGLSVAYLKRVNGLRSGKVMVGQRLQLSASSYRQKKLHPRRVHKKRGGRRS